MEVGKLPTTQLRTYFSFISNPGTEYSFRAYLYTSSPARRIHVAQPQLRSSTGTVPRKGGWVLPPRFATLIQFSGHTEYLATVACVVIQTTELVVLSETSLEGL